MKSTPSHILYPVFKFRFLLIKQFWSFSGYSSFSQEHEKIWSKCLLLRSEFQRGRYSPRSWPIPVPILWKCPGSWAEIRRLLNRTKFYKKVTFQIREWLWRNWRVLGINLFKFDVIWSESMYSTYSIFSNWIDVFDVFDIFDVHRCIRRIRYFRCKLMLMWHFDSFCESGITISRWSVCVCVSGRVELYLFFGILLSTLGVPE